MVNREPRVAEAVRVFGITLGVWLAIIAIGVLLAWSIGLLLGTRWDLSNQL